jgi:hypothetical protein
MERPAMIARLLVHPAAWIVAVLALLLSPVVVAELLDSDLAHRVTYLVLFK